MWTFSLDTLRRRLRKLPMLPLLVSLIAGILIAQYLALPPFLPLAVVAALLLLAAALRRVREAILVVAILFIGMGAENLSLALSSSPSAEPSRNALHEYALDRLNRIMPEGEERATVLALVVARRDEMSPSLKKAYAVCGAAHLLAVSGLHVGIVFLLVNLLLAPLIGLRHGSALRSVVAVALIWLYVALCNAPPSAVRAAIMFSALQSATLANRLYTGLNLAAAAAFFMILAESSIVTNVGFLFSFVAVGAIILWGIPLMQRLRSGNPLLDSLVATLVVGAVSTVAVLPITSYVFGVVAFVGVLLNPILLLFAYVILFSAALSLVLPINVAVWSIWGATSVAKIQQWIVESVSRSEFGFLEWSMSPYGVVALYCAMLAAALLAGAIQRKTVIRL